MKPATFSRYFSWGFIVFPFIGSALAAWFGNVAWQTAFAYLAPISLFGWSCQLFLSKNTNKEDSILYHAFWQEMPYFYCRFTADGFLQAINPACAALYHKSVDELIQAKTNLFHLFTSEESQRLQQLLAQLSEEQPIRIEQQKYWNANGKPVFIQWVYRAVYNKRQQLLGYQCLGQDVTGLHQLKEQYQQKHIQLKTLLDHSPAAIILLNQEEEVLVWNRTAEILFGYSEAEVLHRPMPIVPDKQKREFLEHLQQNYQGKSFIDWETAFCRKDGSLLDVSISASPLHNEAGEVIGSLGILTDISLRKSAEDQLATREHLFQSVINNDPNGIFVKDDQGNYVLANQVMAELYGIDTEHLAPGSSIEKEIIKRISIEKNEEYYRTDLEVIRSQKPLHLLQEFFEDSNGQQHWFDTSKIPLQLKDGKKYVLGVAVDITKHIEIEQRLEKAKEEAEKANQTKNQFLANISDDLRTPLNGILGMADLLSDEALEENQQQYVQNLKFSAERLSQIINDLLDFSKMVTGRLQINEQEFDFESILQKVVVPFKKRAQKKGLVFTVENDLPLKNYLVGDAMHLQQILFNVLNNAIQFTYSGGVQLQTKIHEETADQVTLDFVVRDTGIGIPRDKTHSIFESFAKLKSFQDKSSSGLGLGLTITQKLLELMNGRVEVESQLGRGSSFIIQIPFRLGAKIAQVSNGSAQLVSGKSKRRANILVAEDDDISRMYVMKILMKNGWAVDSASDGYEVLDRLQNERLDLILMDISMPKLDGLKTAQIIREKERGMGRHIPIMAITAHTFEEDREKCLQAGMNDYIAKPFEPVDLCRKIENLLEKHESSQ